MEEHPVQQSIRGIDVYLVGGTDMVSYLVGERSGVTRIEACQKSGLHANIPYVRVWKGDLCEAEFCQHNIIGVYFEDVAAAPAVTETASCGHPANSFECGVCSPF